jgi:PAS domain S-box-containing protein
MKLWLIIAILSVGVPMVVDAQDRVPEPEGDPLENVLQLDGSVSYVELPPKVFNTLGEATVEAWVRWHHFDGEQKRVFNYGDVRDDLGLGANRRDLRFVIVDAKANKINNVVVQGALTTNQWYHLACISGAQGMRLYLNGVLVGTNAFAGSFASLKNPARNFLGQRVSATDRNTQFDGEIDEVRVWGVARTEQEIRSAMYSKLTGQEPGLAACWNFDDGTARDSSTNGYHGMLAGNAKVAKVRRPVPSELNLPTVLFGKVTDRAGRPVQNAAIRLSRQGRTFTTLYSLVDGNYSVALAPQPDGFDIQASAGELGAWVTGVTCPRGQRKEVNLILSNALSIGGKVTAFDGSLIPDVIVQVLLADAPLGQPGQLATPGLVATTVTTTANAAQSYRFLNLRAGDYKVRIHLPDGPLDYHQGEVLRAEPGKNLEADFQVAPFRKGRWRRYSTANGLPSNGVYDLHFSSEGTLWLATQNGISHFDGLKFTNLSERDGLMDNRVFAIHPGKEGALWFGMEKGLSLFDTATGQFQKGFPSGTDGLTAGRVFDIETTSDGTLWVRTREGLSRFDGQTFQSIPGIPRITLDASLTKTKALAVDRQNRVWTVTQGLDLFRIDGTNVSRLTPEHGLATRNQDALHVAPDGAVWLQEDMSTFRGITRHAGDRFEALRASEMGGGSTVTAIHTTPQGVLWFGYFGGGVTRFDPASHSFVWFGEHSGAPPAWVLNIQTGPDGALWFASETGLYRYDEETFANYGKADGLPGESVDVSAVTQDGSLWFSSVDHNPFLVRLAGRTNRWENRFVNATEEGLTGIWPYALEPDAKGGLWVGGTAGRGVYYYDPSARARSKKPFRELPALEIFRSWPNMAFHLDERNNTLWVGKGVQGLHRVSLENLEERKSVATKVEGITNSVEVIYQDSKGAIWTAERYGNSPISRLQGDEVQYFSADTTEGGLPSGRVSCFQEGADGYLYIGTASGLARYDGKRFASFQGTSDRPVPAGMIRSILRDRENVLWFASDSGLFRYDGIAWSSLDEEDGLAGLVAQTVIQDHEGNYWVGTDKGLTRYRATRRKPLPPYLIVKTDLEYPGTQQIPPITSGQLVGFRFNVVNFQTQPFRRFYRTALVPGRAQAPPAPRDLVWREPTLTTQYDWNPKAPGDYTFFVQFIDRDLNYSEPARAFLKIVRPWYANLAIMLPSGSALLGLVFISGFSATRAVKRKREAERLRQQLFEMEHREREALQAEITVRKKAEESLRASEELYHSLVDHMPQYVNRKDAQGRYTFVNSSTAEFLGLPAAELLGKDDSIWAPRKVYEEIHAGDLEVIATGQSEEGVRLVELPGGQKLYLHFQKTPLRNAKGEVYGMQTLAWDITRLKETEVALREAKEAADAASQAKSRFLANMSHELRTPLTAIIGFSEMLQSEAQAENRAEQAEDLNRIYESATHLLAVINDILDLSKVEAQKMELHLEKFDVGKLVREVIAIIRPLAEKKANRLIIDCPEEIGWMHADQVKVRQCLVNLLGNANKFTDQGEVRLRVWKSAVGSPKPETNPSDQVSLNPQPSTLHFEIHDSGIGMTREQISRLFQAFSQAEVTTARKYGGTGLGLAITKHFCEMMGGTIRVESEPGQGSTFTLELPAEPKPSQIQTPSARSTSVTARAGHGPCVLVIDDDPNVHRLIEKTLKEEALAVRFAKDGEEGLRMARELRPVAITLDVMMPHTDGWAVLTALKADAELAAIPVIMLSIIGEQELGFALGASEYLTKPIDQNRLLATLRKYLPDASGGHVLIVEDDAKLRELMRRRMEGENWTVTEAENGRAALESLRAGVPSVIVLDLMMPVMDGFAMLAELRRHETWQRIPVVVITAMDLSKADRQRLQGQSQSILAKGSQIGLELIREVRQCLELSRAAR